MANAYYLIYKPYDVISQFTKETPDDKTLANLGFEFPSDVYPVGRLDKDSEGLLLLTNDNQLKTKLLDPKLNYKKTYWAQVENIPTPQAIEQLSKGVKIRIDKKEYKTLPAKVKLLTDVRIAARNPPIRERKSIPTAWLEISLNEGKNRQIRRMCAAVGFPLLRLIRVKIEHFTIEGLNAGDVKTLTLADVKPILGGLRK